MEEPIASALRILNVFTFDLDVIKIQCLFGKDDPVVNFLFVLMMLPAFMAALACIAFGTRILWNALGVPGKLGIGMDRYMNAVGLVAIICYISITITVLRPLHCLANPNDSSSMASNPAVVCWQSSQHSWLVGLSIVGILVYPITVLATVAHVTWRYPSLLCLG